MRTLALAILAAVSLSLASPGLGAEGKQGRAKDTGKSESRQGKKKQQPQTRHELVVLVLHATNAGTGIDQRIADMPELKKPPFSSFDSYALLQTRRVVLLKDKPQRIRLPNRRVLQAQLLDVLRDGAVRLSARINQPGGKTFLPLLEVKARLSQPFIVAGQQYKQGILVLVVRVNEAPPAGEGNPK
jgi:hypothetical protein